MISLESGGILARYFVWSCDHLPLTTASYYVVEEGKKIERRRTGAHYIGYGTTLCHIFWAILWVPLISAAIVSFFVFMFGLMHVLAHNDFMLKNPDSGAFVSAASYFLPEAFAAGIMLVAGCVVLACIGGSKTGFFSLLWQYLKGVKQRICPLVRFDGTP